MTYRRETGLLDFEWRALSQVGEHAPLTLIQLIPLLSRDKGQVGRTLAALEERGLISREKIGGGRHVLLHMSDRGRQVYARLAELGLRRNDVLLAGLNEYEYQKESGGVSRDEMMEAAHRAIERATALNLTDLKRGLSGLATVGATAPFVGLFGTVAGIINAFRGMALTGSGGIGAISAGIAEALVATAFGLFVAIPAVWAFNYLTTRVEGFTVEMDNSASELIDYMAKKTAN